MDVESLIFTDFVATGELTITVLDGGENADWGLMHWDAQIPMGSLLEVAVRAGDDPANLGTFAPVPDAPFDLSDIVDPAARFLQYRLTLGGNAEGDSPIVREVSVNALVLTAPDPLIAGQVNEIDLSWGRPGDVVRLAIAPRAGQSGVQGCPGLALGLPPGSVRAGTTIDANGQGTIALALPAALAGRKLFLQAFQRSSCTASHRLSPGVSAGLQ